MSSESVRAASRWTTRTIPIVLAAAVGYATWVTVAHICVDYLINSRAEAGAAIAILTLYFLLLLLMLFAYARTIWTINTDAGLVPLGQLALDRRESRKNNQKESSGNGDIESQPYYATPDSDPDSPGLEQFYTRDVFVCENDGRPKWCSQCCNWKPDRAHHSSEIDRCVIRMDHYCPWVGGMVGENSFKFFTQFTMYTACYCGVVLGAAGSSLQKQISNGDPLDGYIIAVLGIGGFFGLFTFMITMTSWRYIATNMTNIDMLGAKSRVYQLAVRISRGGEATERYQTISYPLPAQERAANGQVNEDLPINQARYDGAADSQDQTVSGRDALATRTYAILKTEPGENPWDLGVWHNWQEVMGYHVLDWFLPLRRSPCANHDSHESYYRMGSVMKQIRTRYGIQDAPADETDKMELRNLNGSRA